MIVLLGIYVDVKIGYVVVMGMLGDLNRKMVNDNIVNVGN